MDAAEPADAVVILLCCGLDEPVVSHAERGALEVEVATGLLADRLPVTAVQDEVAVCEDGYRD